GPLVARASLGIRGADLLARRLGHLPLPGAAALRPRQEAPRAVARPTRQREASQHAGSAGSGGGARGGARGSDAEARLGPRRCGQVFSVRQQRGRRDDDRGGAHTARAGPDDRGGVVRRLRSGRQGAGERRQSAAGRLLRERLMALRELDVQRVLVVGAGVMGSGIAQVAARAGYRTELYDVAAGAAQRAQERIAESLGRAVEKGRCTPSERDDALSRLSVATDLDSSAAAADLIIEAAPEDLQLKKDLFARLSRAARPEAILASNTSSLPITALASATRHPGRVVGLHFFNPVPAMKLLEIVQ